MSTPLQIDSNRKNSQQSTGPVTEDGKTRSSLNATRHGFTGQSLVLSPDEKDAYQAHVAGYLAEYEPLGAEESELLHQYADLRWTLHQISIQQQNLLALLNAATRQLLEANDPPAAAPALIPYTKMLNTLGIYEQRRRRAADETHTRLQHLIFARAEAGKRELAQAARFSAMCQAKKKIFHSEEFGFVCSTKDVDALIRKNRQQEELATYEESIEEDYSK